MDIHSDIGKRLRKFRLRQEMKSVKEFADKIGENMNTIYSYEKGRNKITNDVIAKIQSAFPRMDVARFLKEGIETPFIPAEGETVPPEVAPFRQGDRIHISEGGEIIGNGANSLTPKEQSDYLRRVEANVRMGYDVLSIPQSIGSLRTWAEEKYGSIEEFARVCGVDSEGVAILQGIVPIPQKEAIVKLGRIFENEINASTKEQEAEYAEGYSPEEIEQICEIVTASLRQALRAVKRRAPALNGHLSDHIAR